METSSHATANQNDNDIQAYGQSNAKQVNLIEKLPKLVYYVESPDDDTVLVGMDVTIYRDKIGEEIVTSVSWYDTSHERMMTAAETEKRDDDFTFKRAEHEGGGSYHFTPMNLEIYNSKVKHRLIAGAEFTNEEDLNRAFLATAEDEV